MNKKTGQNMRPASMFGICVFLCLHGLKSQVLLVLTDDGDLPLSPVLQVKSVLCSAPVHFYENNTC